MIDTANTIKPEATSNNGDPRITIISPKPEPLPEKFGGVNSYNQDLTVPQLATFNTKDLALNPLPDATNSGYDPETLVLTEATQNAQAANTFRPKTAPSVMQSVAEGKNHYAGTLQAIKDGKLFKRHSPWEVIDKEEAEKLKKAKPEEKPVIQSQYKAVYTSTPRGIDNPEAAQVLDAGRKNPKKSYYLLVAGPDKTQTEAINEGAAAGAEKVANVMLAVGTATAAVLLVCRAPKGIKWVKKRLFGPKNIEKFSLTPKRHWKDSWGKLLAKSTLGAGLLLGTGALTGATINVQYKQQHSSMQDKTDQIAKELEQQGVPKANIVTLFNPTRAEYEATANQFATKANEDPDSTAHVYLALHGYTKEQAGLKVLRDPGPNRTAGDKHYAGLLSNKTPQSSTLGEDDLKKLDQNVDRPLGILLDSCFSGAAVKVNPAAKPEQTTGYA